MTASSILGYFQHNAHPFLIQFSENWGIRYYGVAYILGFVVGAWLLARYYKYDRSPYDANQQSDLFVALIIGVVLGGRTGYFLFYTPELILSEPWKIFFVWEGGMASHGGFLGVAAATAYIARKHEQSFWLTADLVCSLAPAGLLFGRIANFLNGELWGKAATVSWAFFFPTAPDGGTIARHPSQLYEAALEGFVMLAYSQFRIWKTPVLKSHPGTLVGEFLLLYSVLRIVGEQFREPDADLTFNLLSRGTTLSILMAPAGLWMIWRARNKTRSSKL
ncbi:MAG: prolipoprotein diacylglyceryl transferase [Opitutales bacterium]|nr:prolipoprotein diacylglyceryl transferase [Opitutales bacterium]